MQDKTEEKGWMREEILWTALEKKVWDRNLRAVELLVSELVKIHQGKKVEIKE